MNEIKQMLTVDQQATYQIKVPGNLSNRWADWAGGMTVMVEPDENGLPGISLTGQFDQAALLGLLRRPYSLGLPLISVICVGYDSDELRIQK